jgi:hypothetical protein
MCDEREQQQSFESEIVSHVFQIVDSFLYAAMISSRCILLSAEKNAWHSWRSARWKEPTASQQLRVEWLAARTIQSQVQLINAHLRRKSDKKAGPREMDFDIPQNIPTHLGLWNSFETMYWAKG